MKKEGSGLSYEAAEVLRDDIFNRIHTSKRGQGLIHSAGLFPVSQDPERWGVGVSVDPKISDEMILEGVPESQHDSIRIRHTDDAPRAH